MNDSNLNNELADNIELAGLRKENQSLQKQCGVKDAALLDCIDHIKKGYGYVEELTTKTTGLDCIATATAALSPSAQDWVRKSEVDKLRAGLSDIVDYIEMFQAAIPVAMTVIRNKAKAALSSEAGNGWVMQCDQETASGKRCINALFHLGACRFESKEAE